MSNDLNKSNLVNEPREASERDLKKEAQLEKARNHQRIARANRALLEKRETDEFTTNQFEKALDRHIRMLVAVEKANGTVNNPLKKLTPAQTIALPFMYEQTKRLLETLEDMSKNRSPRVLLALEAVRKFGIEGRRFAFMLLNSIDLGLIEWPTDADEFLRLVEEDISRSPQRFIQYVRTPTQTQIKLRPYGE